MEEEESDGVEARGSSCGSRSGDEMAHASAPLSQWRRWDVSVTVVALRSTLLPPTVEGLQRTALSAERSVKHQPVFGCGSAGAKGPLDSLIMLAPFAHSRSLGGSASRAAAALARGREERRAGARRGVHGSQFELLCLASALAPPSLRRLEATLQVQRSAGRSSRLPAFRSAGCNVLSPAATQSQISVPERTQTTPTQFATHADSLTGSHR